MILIGHPYIAFEAFEKIENKADISHTKPNATVVFDFCEECVKTCHYARENGVNFALFVRDTRDVILASSLGASYIICDKALAKRAQTFADDYLFDAKILLHSNTDDDIEYAAQNSIDGILFEKGIKDGSH